ncbi:hypothetical protein GGS24DRAFT_460787 [Hypoxylon argillaceum]|nr:hypothetical protein GGS24DRAFT_460787 [Hypoxylon argillaceum]
MLFANTFHKLGGPVGGYMTSSSKKIDYQAFDDYGISYEYSVEWIFNCVTLWDRQNFRFPLNEDDLASARQLFVDDFKHCNNGGVGGSTQVGCLRYTFIGGR